MSEADMHDYRLTSPEEHGDELRRELFTTCCEARSYGKHTVSRLRDKPRIGHSCAPAIANGLTISIFDAASLQKGELFPSFS